MAKLIGISGAKFAGKTEVANILRDQLNGAMILNLPEPIYHACMAIFGWSYEQCTDPVLREQIDERYGVSPRYAQQTLGTEWGRNIIHGELWLIRADDVLATIEENMSINFAIVPNIRFYNEALWIRRNGGIVFNVHRNGYELDHSHGSEVGIPAELIDAHIHNMNYASDWREILADEVDNMLELFLSETLPHRQENK